jgi:lipopolysaccharide/colanic/teichoic acid biosynthesis glycosyltransferase
MAFFPEDLFSTLLLLERKRCERSGHRFALALLDVTRLSDTLPLSDYICSQMRETDIAGWYRDPCVIGIIFTTLNGAPIPLVRSRLHSKINDTLQAILSPEESDKVTVTLFIFPEDISRELYPEVFTAKRKTSFHVMKRIVDIAGSLTALFLLSPVIFTIALMVKLSSPGPILFKQKRLGLLGKQFDFLKFRTMYTNNDASIHQQYVADLIQNQQKDSLIFKIQNDPRVTRIGRYLRKLSLDELPQFMNVLMGEMSLVGPRPPIPYELENYQCWHRRRVLEVKPGITGLWQVHGRSRTTFDEMVRLDIRYINEQSGWLDFVIVLQTPRAVLSASGAY